jgi:hypothetical protein
MGQSRMDNPEKLATWDTQDIRPRQRQTIQRNWQQRVHKT